MSFVNLMSNDVWSEHDILRRTEAMVRSEFSVTAETILNRKLQGATMGIALSPTDMVEIERFQTVVIAAQTEGINARIDMASLQAVLDYEAALARMAQLDYDGPATVLDGEGNEIPNPAAVLWEAEWNAAAQLVGQVSAETVALHALRHPPEPVIEPEVQE